MTRSTGMLSLLALASCRIDPPSASDYDPESAASSGLGSESAGPGGADSETTASEDMGSPSTGTTSMGLDGTDSTSMSLDGTDSTSMGLDGTDSSGFETESTSGSTSGTEASDTGPDPVCGDGIVGSSEACDGADLGGASCESEGFDAGAIGCSPDCIAYDTSGCVTFECGNGVIEGREACDGADLAGSDCIGQDYDAGTLGCQPSCTAYDVSGCVMFECGNGALDPGEDCDGEGETPECDANCTFAMCGDLTLNASLGEACDTGDLGGASCASQGFDGGVLDCHDSCQLDTTGCHVCGDTVLNGAEQCDGGDLGGQTCVTQGFDGGGLACSPDCGAFDTSACFACGDGSIEGNEICDGADLGGATCDSLGLFGGTLACSPSCTFDFTTCDVAGVPFGSDAGYLGYEAQPPVLPCDDISGTGTPTVLTDDTVIGVSMGFTFPVYGVAHTEVAIESNGALHWGDSNYLTYDNTCLPSAVEPSLSNLYVFWDDLNPGVGTSEVYYQTLGPVGSRRFVVQWDTAFYSGDAFDYIRVQAMLYEASGHIGVCYVDTISAAHPRNNGAEATAGIQQNSMTGFGYSCNTPDLVNGLLLLYAPVSP